MADSTSASGTINPPGGTPAGGGNPPTGKPTPQKNPPPLQGGNPPRGGPGVNTGGPGVYTPPPSPLQGMINSLSGSTRDAFVALEQLFTQYGLGSLVNNIFNFIKQGYSQDTITLLLQDTPEYKQRFAGNAIRQKNGLAILSPADYLATEASYYQVVKAAGLPANFYNSTSDWVNWIGNDVSPTEVQSRVQMAQTATETAPPDLVQALGQMGVPKQSLVAYFLDDTKALPILQQQFNAGPWCRPRSRPRGTATSWTTPRPCLSYSSSSMLRRSALPLCGTTWSWIPPGPRRSPTWASQWTRPTPPISRSARPCRHWKSWAVSTTRTTPSRRQRTTCCL